MKIEWGSDVEIKNMKTDMTLFNYGNLNMDMDYLYGFTIKITPRVWIYIRNRQTMSGI